MAVLDSAFLFPINPSPRLYGALVAAIPGRTSLTNGCGRLSLDEHSLPFTALQGFSHCSGGAFPIVAELFLSFPYDSKRDILSHC